MVDCENEVFTKIAEALRAEFPGINVSSEFTLTPTSLPHVSIVMADNPIMFSVMDTAHYEVAIPLFEINIFADGPTKKSKCKKIGTLIDETLKPYNFRRMAYTPVDNRYSPSVYRIAARYRVATDGTNFYRR